MESEENSKTKILSVSTFLAQILDLIKIELLQQYITIRLLRKKMNHKYIKHLKKIHNVFCIRYIVVTKSYCFIFPTVSKLHFNCICFLNIIV